MIITSAQNPLIKQLKQLKLAKYRHQTQTTLMAGQKIIADYLAAGGRVKQLVASEKLADSDLLSVAGVEQAVVVADDLARQLSPVENNGGMLAVIAVPQFDLAAEMDRVQASQQSILLIDRIQDPGNLGNIVRTAVAVGLGAIVLSTGSADPWSPKVIRASAGGVFSLPIIVNADLVSLITDYDLPVYAATLDATDDLYDLDLRQPIAWLVGNEGQGVDPQLLEVASQRVKIPQSLAIESLNLATATAVCLYEQLRQNQ